MADHSSGISDPGCLGALYNAEEDVYQGSGWTDVADQVLTEPQETATIGWSRPSCSSRRISTRWTSSTNGSGTGRTASARTCWSMIGENQFDWHFEGIGISDNMMTQTSRQSNGGDWACQHALGAEGDYIVETSACGNSPEGEAVMLANQIVANLK